MSKQAQVYAWSVIAAGTAVAAASAALWDPVDLGAFAACLCLAILAASFKVNLPGMTGTVTPAFVFVLVAAARLSFSETLAVAGAAAVMQCLWRARINPTPLQVAFNTSVMILASGLAHGVSHGMTAATGSMHATHLAVAGVTLLVVNTMMVAAILCLLQGKPLHNVWRSIQLWSVPYYLAGGVLAYVWSDANLASSAGLGLIAAVSTYLLYSVYREAVQRIEPQTHP
jgi:hypothetical protein